MNRRYFLLLALLCLTGNVTVAQSDTLIVINEILADPPPDRDVNGDLADSTTQDEFVELVNVSGNAIDLTGWTLEDSISERHTFTAGTMLADGQAIVVFGGGNPAAIDGVIVQRSMLGLNNSGDTVTLRNISNQIIDQVTYGSEGGDDQSLTRNPDLFGETFVKHRDVGVTNAQYSPGMRVDGSPFSADYALPDLLVSIDGDEAAKGETPLTVTVTNNGVSLADSVALTVTLSAEFSLITANINTDEIVNGNMISYALGDIAGNDSVSVEVVVAPAEGARGYGTATADVTMRSAELSATNNTDRFTVLLGDVILINAVYNDGLADQDADEAVQLINLSDEDVDLFGWQLGDANGLGTFPGDVIIAANSTAWIAKESASFEAQFGFPPQFDSAFISSWKAMNNDGDVARLLDANGNVIDAVVYEEPEITAGWTGDPINTHTVGQNGGTGQIISRKLDQLTMLPVPDTNTAADWAQDRNDFVNGRRVQYPGWDLEQFFFTARATQSAMIEIGIAPDNSYEMVKSYIDSANRSIKLQLLHFTNKPLMDGVIAAVNRGVRVDILLEGEQMSNEVKTLCEALEAAISDAGRDGGCYWMISESANDIYDRYKYMHAKYMIVDDMKALITSDNFTRSSMPYDDKIDGTSGRRGTLIGTDAAVVVDRLLDIWAADFDPKKHQDIFPYTSNHALYGNKYGEPDELVVFDMSNPMTHTVQYPASVTFDDATTFELIQSPENALRDVDGLLGLLKQAERGDTIYVQQQYEYGWWTSGGNAQDDPNVRLEAYIDAARRGASVWLQLDSSRFFQQLEYDEVGNAQDTASSNAVSCGYVNRVAAAEELSLWCQIAVPADLGIHNKMILAEIDGKGYVNIGSMNGSETASKVSREVALQVQSDGAYAYLRQMFLNDWEHITHLPILLVPQARAAHPVITEVMYDPRDETTDDSANDPCILPDSPHIDENEALSFTDLGEYVEIANPTRSAIDLNSWRLSDASIPSDYEDQRIFTNLSRSTILQPNEVWVIARRASCFAARYGFNPTWELENSDEAIPNLIDDPDYSEVGAGVMRFANSGDQVYLRDQNNINVDVFIYGTDDRSTSDFSDDLVGVPLLPNNFSYERRPWWSDTGIFQDDFTGLAQGNPFIVRD